MSGVPPGVFLLLTAVKATLLIAVALFAVRVLKHSSAALRHACLLAAMIGALLLPILGLLLPSLSPFRLTAEAPSGNPELRAWSDNAIDLILIRSDVFQGGPDGKDAVLLRSSWRVLAEEVTPAFLIIWVIGSIVVLARMLAGMAAAHGWRERARLRARIGRRIRILESSEIGAPLTVGVVRPVILIPDGCNEEPQAYRAMITHELAHVERGDCLTQCIVRVVCAIYWFNPLVWHVARRIALEQERACDDRVLTSGVDPILYSEVLIDAARNIVANPMRMPLPSMALPAHLERRIVGILDDTVRRTGLSVMKAAAITIVMSLVTFPLAALALEDRPSREAGLDPYFHSASERVPGVRGAQNRLAIPNTRSAESSLMARLQAAAAREPQSEDDLVPDRARWALGSATNGRFVECWMDSLAHPDWRVRGYAAWVLGQSGDPRAVDPLMRLLDHPVWRLRAMAAAALCSLGDGRAIPAMTELLTDPAWQVRMEAVAFLGKQGPTYRSLIEPFQNDEHLAIRTAARQALNQ